MTDHSPAAPDPVDPDVELASAHLDGEAGPDERARIDDPAVAGRSAELERVVEQVRDIPPAPAGLVDDQVARAMAAFDAHGRVVGIGRGRSDSPWWQRIPLGAVAAILVVVAIVGLAGLTSRGGDEDDTATAAFDSADDDSSGPASGRADAAEESVAADTMDEGAATESAPSAGGSGLQTFATYDELAVALRDELSARSGAATTDQAPPAEGSEREAEDAGAGEALDPCGALQTAGIDPAGVVLLRPAFVESEDVTAVVHDAPDGRRLTVVQQRTCTVVVDRLL